MSLQHHQTLLLQDQDSSIQSSVIKHQGQLTTQPTHTKSLCHEQIISENCQDESFQDDELYNQESSLPLCMKEYYINEKEVKYSTSQRNQELNLAQYHDNTQHETQSNREQQYQYQHQHQKLKLVGFQNPLHHHQNNPLLETQNKHYHQTIQQRNKILSVQLQNQRIKNLHFQKMLSILIDQDQIQKQKFQSITKDYQQKIETYKQIQTQNRIMKIRNQQLQRQITHYKDLIYLANNNYQILESKLQEASSKILGLELQREQREKNYHEKLQNLKQVMKSLMSNLKADYIQSDNHEMPQFRIDSKDAFSPQNCYSFGDHDASLRERKDKNKHQTKAQLFNCAHQQGKFTKPSLGADKLNTKHPSTATKKTFEKQNLFLTERIDDSFENKNFSSTKTTMNKLKSPKNLTVEENYRKLFMKTLISSSQKPQK